MLLLASDHEDSNDDEESVRHELPPEKWIVAMGSRNGWAL